MNAEELRQLSIKKRKEKEAEEKRKYEELRKACDDAKSLGIKQAPKTLKIIQDRMVRDPLAGRYRHLVSRSSGNRSVDVSWVSNHLSAVKEELEKLGFSVTLSKLSQSQIPEVSAYIIVEWETE